MVKSFEELAVLKEKIEKKKSQISKKTQIIVQEGTCGIASGAKEILAATKLEIEQKKVTDVVILEYSCLGGCCFEPCVTIIDKDGTNTLYGFLDKEKIKEIVEKHVVKGEVVRDYVIDQNAPFFTHQVKRVTALLGKIDPFKIEDYISFDGYQALAKAMQIERKEVIEEVKKSGLRGRGGAGFPTGLKWTFAYNAKGDQKYIVCNADEGDPGAYMNRAEMEGNPHALLEGMAIAGYAIGANKGYVYVRAEYPLAVETLKIAIAQAREYGLLGQNVFGTDFNFDIELFLGSGAFVCGEETALLASLEQKRGNPRPRPPFPANEGLFGKPTVINNVGTLSNIPLIIRNGASWWSSVGTEGTKGTKVFCLTGKIKNTALIEVPMGITLGEVVFDIGEGIPDNKKFKAAQLGGPSGGCVPMEYLNMPIDYESLKEIGSMMGSGGMVVLDEDSCMVDTARFFLEFDKDESCGKCLPCRRGLPLMIDTLTKITEGKGKIEDLEALENLAKGIEKTALCALGQTAANPTLSTIRHFRDEYEAHIIDKTCPAGICASLFRTKCQNACPVSQDVPTYLALVKEGKFEEAYKVIRQTNPLPLVLGRVCNHPCESKCERGNLDEPIAIRHIKRFVADYAYENHFEYNPQPKQMRNERIAIVGSGPAGLSAAYDLAIDGYEVTIFEALPVAGGMLAVGIPEYRLPNSILNYEIERIKKMGVEIKLNTCIETIEDLFSKGFKAVFLAIGAHSERKMDIPGESLKGVYWGVEFLRSANLGKQVELGKSVIVIGGGNSAMDCARVAKRMGADVRIVYRRERKDMPAIEEDIEAAEQEGIKLDCLSIPIGIMGDGKVSKVKCARMELREFDRSGRKKPYKIEGAEYVIEADAVIESIGQFPESDFLNDGKIKLAKNRTIVVDQRTLATNMEGIFAGGDAVSGPLTVIDAVAAGQRAVSSIKRYLRGETLGPIPEREAHERYQIPFASDEDPQEKPRVKIKESDVEIRTANFQETTSNYSKEEAMEEAERCLRCDAELS